MNSNPQFKDIATHIVKAAEHSVNALRQGRIEQEPAMTDRMLGAIEISLDGFISNGMTWRAKTLTDRGSGAQESRYGADFMGVLDIRMPDRYISKGFLAQAKLSRAPKIENARVKDLDDLTRQCEQMLELSPESYVFLYHKSGIRVVLATRITESGRDPWSIPSISVQQFFEDHLKCTIGDRKIQAPTPEALNDLRREYEARKAILIQAAPSLDT